MENVDFGSLTCGVRLDTTCANGELADRGDGPFVRGCFNMGRAERVMTRSRTPPLGLSAPVGEELWSGSDRGCFFASLRSKVRGEGGGALSGA